MKVQHKIKIVALGAMLCISQLVMAQAGGTAGTVTSTDPPSYGGVADIVNESYKPSIKRDGVIDVVPHNNYYVPWQTIREADVLFKKRVWREIDTRLKQNISMRYPGDDESGGGMYIEILIEAIKHGKITAFSDERFTIPLNADDVMAKVAGKADTTEVEDPETGEMKKIITIKKFNPESVTKFRIKEDWIFDKNIGRMVTRIIGISPYQDKLNEDGSYRGTAPIFWLYYPELRAINTRYEVYNPQNDVYRITWDDFFEKRFFSAHIIKSNINNPLQEDIKTFKQGVDALQASEELKELLFNKEHDLWVY
jgi:gliding motility associated protien GldN